MNSNYEENEYTKSFFEYFENNSQCLENFCMTSSINPLSPQIKEEEKLNIKQKHYLNKFGKLEELKKRDLLERRKNNVFFQEISESKFSTPEGSDFTFNANSSEIKNPKILKKLAIDFQNTKISEFILTPKNSKNKKEIMFIKSAQSSEFDFKLENKLNKKKIPDNCILNEFFYLIKKEKKQILKSYNTNKSLNWPGLNFPVFTSSIIQKNLRKRDFIDALKDTFSINQKLKYENSLKFSESLINESEEDSTSWLF